MPSEANGDVGVPEWGRQPRVWDGIGASGFFTEDFRAHSRDSVIGKNLRRESR